MKAFYWFLVRYFSFYALFFYVHLNFKYEIFSHIGVQDVSILYTCFPLLLTHLMLRSLPHYLTKAAILDNPNFRSMHTAPTPRGAGWAVTIPLLAYLASTVISSALDGTLWRTHAPPECDIDCFIIRKGMLGIGLIFGLLMLTTISWMDDRKNMPASLRLLCQFCAAAVTLLTFVIPSPDTHLASAIQRSFNFLPSGFPIWLAVISILIVWVGFINVYNFMDGIDGITAIETITLSSGIIAAFIIKINLFSDTHEIIPPQIIESLLIFLLCSLVFLFHNWHPAKIFLGDVGSVTIGYLMGFFLLVIISAGYWYVALTLPLYYLADGGITLARRILRGEKFWEAHRTHFYQRAAQAAGRHDVVVLKIAACNVVLIGIAMLELLVSPWFVLAAPLPVALLLHNMAHQRHIGVKSPNG